MRFEFIFVVILWFGIKFSATFNIGNKLSDGNVTAQLNGSSLLEISEKENISSVFIDEFSGIDISNSSSSAHEHILQSNKNSFASNSITNPNHSGQQKALLSSRDQVRGILLRQRIIPQPRSFLGLIIIPCE